nr:DinB family protein [Streptomyces sp. SID13031]
MLRKLEGLSEYDRRRPLVPSGTNLLGLVKHLAGLEYTYLGECLGRVPPEKLAWVEDETIWDGADMWALPTETSDYLIALYQRACAFADETITSLDLDAPGSVAHWPEGARTTTLGILLIRMVDETAHHAGHADIIRELIDGTGGPDADMLDGPGWTEYYTTLQQAADTFK